MAEFSGENKQRIIQEYVPGKQITLAHVIAKPQQGIYLKLGLDDEGSDAIGILTITPCEGVIIAAAPNECWVYSKYDSSYRESI